MLVIIHCFYKFCRGFIIKQKILIQLINCYEQLFKNQDHRHASLVKPEYMSWNMENEVNNKKFSDYLKDQGVKLYHTYLEPKVSIIE